MKKKTLFLGISVFILLLGSYHFVRVKETKIVLNEMVDSLLSNREYTTLYDMKGKSIYGMDDKLSGGKVIFTEKDDTLLEDPTLEYSMVGEGAGEKFYVSVVGKMLLVDFADSASVAQLVPLNSICPEVTRFRMDTLANGSQNICFSLTVDFPKSTHAKEEEIEDWLFHLGYENSLINAAMNLSYDYSREEWANMLANGFIHRNDRDFPFRSSVLDLRARHFTDKYVTYQLHSCLKRTTLGKLGKERLVSFDFIHQEEIDWGYLFKEQYKEEVLELLCETVYRDERYRRYNPDISKEEITVHINRINDLKRRVDLGLGEEGVVFSYELTIVGSLGKHVYFHFTIPYEKLKPYLTDKAMELLI